MAVKAETVVTKVAAINSSRNIIVGIILSF
jgi:hypothetical protein